MCRVYILCLELLLQEGLSFGCRTYREYLAQDNLPAFEILLLLDQGKALNYFLNLPLKMLENQSIVDPQHQ